MRAVQYDEFGGVDVLRVAEVPVPEPGPGEALVEVAAAGTNPGEAYVREGRYAQRWPSTFPSGQGSDLAGTVRALGAGWTPSRSATRCSGGPTPARARRSTWSCRWARSSPSRRSWRGSRRGRCTSSGPRPGPPCARSTRGPVRRWWCRLRRAGSAC
jgi:NADPH:quinone reductase-like Zn-dependent oxidoreductase